MSQWAVVKDGVNKSFTKIHLDEIEAHEEASRLYLLEINLSWSFRSWADITKKRSS